MASTSNISALEQTGILHRVIEDTCHVIDCEEASIILWDTRRQTFEIGAATSHYRNSIAEHVRSEGGITRWIVDHKQPVLVNDVLADNPFPGNDILGDTGMQSFIGVPIIHEDDVLGVMYALARHPHAFTDEQMQRLQALARMAGIAIHNARLAQHLQELVDFKNAMMGLAAHDLRNPLSRVVGYFNILLEDIDPLAGDHEEWVDQIFRALHQMEDLIDGVLHYEQFTQEGDTLALQPQDLNHLVRSVAEQYQQDLDTKQQQLLLELRDGPLMVNMDVLLLGEALGNVVANAIKYSPERTCIKLRTSHNSDGYQVHVVDEGPGIDTAYHDRIFQPFTRLPDAKSQRGTGLGLNLVKLIVEKHGGSISVESELGKGSTFTIHLPSES